MTSAGSEPRLLDDDISLLLEIFSRPDAIDEAKTIFDLNGAAAEGWRWKAAKAAELISVDLDGERMSSNQLFEHCQQMVRTYAKRRTASVGFNK